MLDRSVFARLDLVSAVRIELSLRNRLLPPRWDYRALADQAEAVEIALRPQLRRGATGSAANVVFCDKGWRGVRPLHVMTLADRVLYRALVQLISHTLPEHVRHRAPIHQFHQAPLDAVGAKYVSKTDVTAYFEYVDHDLLAHELVAQTGEEPAADALLDLLGSVMNRRVGLPQVHTASDVLGDTYIDPVRRRLLRSGHSVFTYADDFRIASSSLGSARAGLEACGREVRELGLVLNDRKTYTYLARNYRRSLDSFGDAERKLFSDSDSGTFDIRFLDSDYEDGLDAVSTLGAEPVDRGVDDEEALVSAVSAVDIDERRVAAARRAWDLWINEDESEESQARHEAAITQSLLGRALPTLGVAGDDGPRENIAEILRFEPALTPQLVAYISSYAQNGQPSRTRLRSALDEVVQADIFGPWQAMWLAQAAGEVRRSRARHPYEDWLIECVATSPHDGLAATAAAALGRLGRGDANVVAAAIDRIAPAWRRLAFWGLIGLDRQVATDVADDSIDRLLLSATET